MLLLLHSAFMLSVVKMLLKGEVGGHALNSHGNHIVDHGKIKEKSRKCVIIFMWEPYSTFMRTAKILTRFCTYRCVHSLSSLFANVRLYRCWQRRSLRLASCVIANKCQHSSLICLAVCTCRIG